MGGWSVSTLDTQVHSNGNMIPDLKSNALPLMYDEATMHTGERSRINTRILRATVCASRNGRDWHQMCSDKLLHDTKGKMSSCRRDVWQWLVL